MESLPDHGHTISVTFWYKVGNQKLPNTDLVSILTTCIYVHVLNVFTVGLNFQKFLFLKLNAVGFLTKYMLLTFRYNEVRMKN